MELDSEAGPKRAGKQSGAGCGAYQGKRIELQLDRPCSRPLVNHYVYLVVLHCGIQILLNHRVQPVYLVNEKHITLIEAGKKSRQVAGLVKDRTRCDLELYLELV